MTNQLTPYLIAPQKMGLERNVEPFFIPEKAFSQLENAFIWRGRLKRRFGSIPLTSPLGSRLRLSVGTTDASGNITGMPPGNRFRVGQMFSIGNVLFTIFQNGAMKRTDGSTATATFNTNMGAFVINDAPSNAVCYFYPSDPVMGIFYRNQAAILDDLLIAFDLQFAYTQDTSGAWIRLSENDSMGNDNGIWTGDDQQFPWVTHYRGANAFDNFLYVVNNVDPIKYLPQESSVWQNLRPQLNSIGTNRYLETARIVLSYRDRLLAFNTKEGATPQTAQQYQNRVRWCQQGNPIEMDAWYDTIIGKGSFLDAPTEEPIISAFRLKETLIVYFEKSTWELSYTGNRILPFRWNSINPNLGSKSTFSVVGFDTSVLALGVNGVHGCDGINVSRIDAKIPDQVYSLYERTGGLEKSHGIRDFYNQVVYWTYVDTDSPNLTTNETYPSKILCYNYENETWAIFNESFTCFSYGRARNGLRWMDISEQWQNYNVEWSSSRVAPYRDIVAGNQQGFTFILTRNFGGNAPSLYVTDITQDSNGLYNVRATDHNVRSMDILRLENAVYDSGTISPIFLQVESINGKNQFKVSVKTGNIPTTTYLGNGTLRKMTGFKVKTKNFNPGTELGRQFSFPYVDFLLDSTREGEITLDYTIDTDNNGSIYEQSESNVLLGDTRHNILSTKPEQMLFEHNNNDQIWHRYHTQAQAQFLQFSFSLSEEQLLDYQIANSDFQMHAFILYAEPQGRITG